MPSLDGITVNILCDGVPLEEYSASLDRTNPPLVSCWIPSLKNQVFTIRYKFRTKDSFDWVCSFECDGIPMRSSRVASGSTIFEHDKARNGNKLFPLLFSEVVGTDNEEVAYNAVNPHMGVVKVEIWRVRLMRKSRAKVYEDERFKLDESPIHESKKIIGGHRVKLGQGTPSVKCLSRSTYLDSDAYRTFKFHYRPRAMLQAMDHIPSIPTSRGIKRRASETETSDFRNQSTPGGGDSETGKLVKKLQSKIQELEQKLEQHHCRPKAKRRKRDVIDLCSD